MSSYKLQVTSCKLQAGFTLVELLVAIAILVILTGMGFGTFSRSQKKARDGQRKSDLHQLQQALETYANDNNGQYPWGYNGEDPGATCHDRDGKIVVLDSDGACWALDWGASPLSDRTIAGGAVYMQQLPEDLSTGRQYFYWSDGGCYKIYAKLENPDDRDIITPGDVTNCSSGGGDPGPDDFCNFGVSSSNTSPTEAGCP